MKVKALLETYEASLHRRWVSLDILGYTVMYTWFHLTISVEPRNQLKLGGALKHLPPMHVKRSHNAKRWRWAASSFEQDFVNQVSNSVDDCELIFAWIRDFRNIFIRDHAYTPYDDQHTCQISKCLLLQFGTVALTLAFLIRCDKWPAHHSLHEYFFIQRTMRPGAFTPVKWQKK